MVTSLDKEKKKKKRKTLWSHSCSIPPKIKYIKKHTNNKKISSIVTSNIWWDTQLILNFWEISSHPLSTIFFPLNILTSSILSFLPKFLWWILHAAYRKSRCHLKLSMLYMQKNSAVTLILWKNCLCSLTIQFFREFSCLIIQADQKCIVSFKLCSLNVFLFPELFPTVDFVKFWLVNDV